MSFGIGQWACETGRRDRHQEGESVLREDRAAVRYQNMAVVAEEDCDVLGHKKFLFSGDDIILLFALFFCTEYLCSIQSCRWSYSCNHWN